MEQSCKKPPFVLDRTRSGTLAGQLAAALRAAIDTGYYGAGDVIPPTRDLAAMLGVSRVVAITAMRQLEDDRLVLRRPHLGCIVCAKDKPLWKGHVVIIVPPLNGNPTDNAVHAVLRDRLIAAGYLTTPVTVATSRPDSHDDFALLDTVLRQQTDLVVQIHDQDRIARWLSSRKVPFVRLTSGSFRPGHCVGLMRNDISLAVPELMAHCRQAGVKDILQVYAFPRADDLAPFANAGLRVRKWRAPVALKHGTPFELADWAATAFAKRLARGRDWLPDLLYFSDDHLATGALLALAVAGVRVPEDVRVATSANRNYGPAYVKQLTRLEIDNESVGEQLADLILEYFRTGEFPSGVVARPAYIRGETF